MITEMMSMLGMCLPDDYLLKEILELGRELQLQGENAKEETKMHFCMFCQMYAQKYAHKAVEQRTGKSFEKQLEELSEARKIFERLKDKNN